MARPTPTPTLARPTPRDLIRTPTPTHFPPLAVSPLNFLVLRRLLFMRTRPKAGRCVQSKGPHGGWQVGRRRWAQKCGTNALLTVWGLGIG
uniref:Uncharacterized protein n=1 Tax=Oryza glumipatula TaxID=40148 RepID=A0A0D9YG42_9ORYZ